MLQVILFHTNVIIFDKWGNLCYSFQSFFGFGQSADIEIQLDGAETRKMAEMKTEDGKKERYFLYYDGESVSGKVSNNKVLPKAIS